MTIVTPPLQTPTCAALGLTTQQRIDLAVDSLQAHCCVSRLAQEHDVSRKFVYRQRHKALDALEDAFTPHPPPQDDVLFHLRVTKAWLRQFVLVAVLVGHSSLRGAQEMLDCLLDHPVSLGWVHSVLQEAIAKAKPLNASVDLSRLLAAALDEIFQNGRPVLAVVDVESTYCCLLTQEEHRDADTWGLRLLELQDRGFAPASLIGDGATGLRAGVKQALPGVCRDADVWHPLRDVGEAIRFLENRAYHAIKAADQFQRQLGGKPSDEPLRQRTLAARSEQDAAIALADRATVLADWLRRDVLALAGPEHRQRRELFDFVLGQLQTLRVECEHRLGPVCSLLANQKEDLLRFAARMDVEVADLALYAKVPEAVVRELVYVQEMADTSQRKWQRDTALREQLGGRYHDVSGLVEALREGVVRASSVVENYNSRLRNYFFLRKEVGGDYLELLRFFLNHRRFIRSERPQRVGKSPAELLDGESHPHWLEMLGYHRFRQAA